MVSENKISKLVAEIELLKSQNAELKNQLSSSQANKNDQEMFSHVIVQRDEYGYVIVQDMEKDGFNIAIRFFQNEEYSRFFTTITKAEKFVKRFATDDKDSGLEQALAFVQKKTQAAIKKNNKIAVEKKSEQKVSVKKAKKNNLEDKVAVKEAVTTEYSSNKYDYLDAAPDISKGEGKIPVRNKKTKEVVAYFEKDLLRSGLAHYLSHLENDNPAELIFRKNFLSQAEVLVDGDWQTVRDYIGDQYENIEITTIKYLERNIKVNFYYYFPQSYYKTDVQAPSGAWGNFKTDTVAAGVKKAIAFLDEYEKEAKKTKERQLAYEKEKKAKEQREMAERRRRDQEEQQRLEREKKEAEERRLASCQEGGLLDWLAGAPKCCECNRRLRRENIVDSQYMGQRLRSEYQRGYVVKDIVVRRYECEFCGTITEKAHQRDA